ncbi:MAG: sialidase family protein [Thermoflexales bacterium]
MTKLHRARTGLSRGLAALAVLVATALPARAQTPIPWTPPTAVTRSGGASLPAIAVGSDEIAHVVWWDKVEGAQYSRSARPIGTTIPVTWTVPINVPSINGGGVVVDARTGLSTTLFARYSNLSLIADGQAAIYGLWLDANLALQSARALNGAWSGAQALADKAAAFSLSGDLSGTIHLVYARPLDAPGAPAGLYYRAARNGAWSAPALIQASAYFRSAPPERLRLSVAANPRGQVLAAFMDPRTNRPQVARSGDAGATWAAPVLAPAGADNGPVDIARVAATPAGGFLLIGRDPTVQGCGLYQRLSLDGGAGWGTPARILPELELCPDALTFTLAADGRLWLIGAPAPPSKEDAARRETRFVMAAWNDSGWTRPVLVSQALPDPASAATVVPTCAMMAMSRRSVAWLGCDGLSDLWAIQNAVPLPELLPALSTRWGPIETLAGPADGAGAKVVDPGSLPAIAADANGNIYAMWSQSARPSETGTALAVAARLTGSAWSRPNEVLRSPDAPGSLSSIERAPNKAVQPALAVLSTDGKERLHAVWSGGTTGQVFYSAALIRDAASARGWADPVALAAPSEVGGAPSIMADGNSLRVIFAVPYNERRGIYTTRSDDAGATWITPTLIFDAVGAGWEGVGGPRLARTPNGLVAAWERAALPGSTTVGAIAAARSADGGRTWSSAVTVAEGAVSAPRVAAVGGDIVLVWRSNPAGRAAQLAARRSGDGGATWEELGVDAALGPPSGETDLIGVQGNVYLAVLTSRTNAESRLAIGRLAGQRLVAMDAQSLGRSAAEGDAVVLVPGQSSELVAVVRTMRDSKVTEAGILAVARAGDAATPGEVVAPTPQPTATARPSPTAARTPTIGPTATHTPVVLQAAKPATANTATVLVAAGALAGVLVLGLSALVGWRRRL